MRPLDPNATAGQISIRIDGPRAARPEDPARVRAVREMRAALDEFGRPEPRREHLEAALGLWHELGERRREAEVLHQMGVEAGQLHRAEEASAHFHRALALWDQLGCSGCRAWTLLKAGRTDQALLREEDGRRHMEEALQVGRRLGLKDLLLQAFYDTGRFYDKEPRTAVQPSSRP